MYACIGLSGIRYTVLLIFLLPLHLLHSVAKNREKTKYGDEIARSQGSTASHQGRSRCVLDGA